jgi:hypothetical protein
MTMNEELNQQNAFQSELIADEQLAADLDAALAPTAPPAALRERSIAAAMAASREQNRANGAGARPPVLARIGRSGLYAAAAAVLLVIVLGEIWWAGSTLQNSDLSGGDVAQNTTPPMPTGNVDDTRVVQKDEPLDGSEALAATLAELNDWSEQTASIDDRLDLLSLQVSLADNAGFWSEAGQQALDDAAASQQLEETFNAFELYF